MPTLQYHFKTNEGPDLGPIGVEEFQQRCEAGEINDDTMVWRSGLTDWMPYSSLRAAEQRAAQTPPAVSRAPSAKKKPVAAPGPRPGFLACGSCAQEWPEGLLFAENGQRICGNCQARQKEALKNGRLKKASSTGGKAWFLIILAIVCTGCLVYKVSHYGIRLPKEKMQELSAPATYGK